MKSGIFIHIGLHKTGTTTLQRFFAHNEGVFNDHGFFFPRACRENKADQIIHSNLSWELMHHGMFDPHSAPMPTLWKKSPTDRRNAAGSSAARDFPGFQNR